MECEVMLSRVADALFWMSRYLERAEHIARLLDVCFHLELDLRGVTTGPYELHWTSLAPILQQPSPPRREPDPDQPPPSPQATLSHWLTFPLDNPNSIMACLSRARSNARSVRGTITTEMWKELNTLYWKLKDAEFVRSATDSPYDFYQAVETGSQAFQGITDATLTHDEGWQFIQLGKYLERADKTLRILDVQYHLLRDMSDPSDLSLSNIQWAAVLKGCRAYQPYQRLFVGRVEPSRVVDFLLLHQGFPRSVRFCLETATRALAGIEGPGTPRGESKADRILGRILADLRFGELEQILAGDLHAFLTSLLDRVGQVSRTIQEQYSLQ